MRRKGGGGASYTRDWKSVTAQCKEIMAIWVSCDTLREHAITKERAIALLRYYGLKITTGSALARISELVGLGVLVQVSRNVKNAPHDTARAPTYLLDAAVCSRILNAGGRI